MDDWLQLGIWELSNRADCGELWAAAVLDELARLRNVEHGTSHVDTDAAFVDAAQIKQLLNIIEKVEWCQVYFHDQKCNRLVCPWCGNFIESGHYERCPRKLALGLRNRHTDTAFVDAAQYTQSGNYEVLR